MQSVHIDALIETNLWGRVDECRHLLPCLLYCLLCIPPVGVSAAVGVSILRQLIGQHGVQHPWVHGCGGLHVKVQRPSLCKRLFDVEAWCVGLVCLDEEGGRHLIDRGVPLVWGARGAVQVE